MSLPPNYSKVYLGTLFNPDITVNVTKLGGVRVYVFGEINKPGAYTLTKSSTVIDAIGALVALTGIQLKRKFT